jgi:hypothetical protein
MHMVATIRPAVSTYVQSKTEGIYLSVHIVFNIYFDPVPNHVHAQLVPRAHPHFSPLTTATFILRSLHL